VFVATMPRSVQRSAPRRTTAALASTSIPWLAMSIVGTITKPGLDGSCWPVSTPEIVRS
jgi:hypothetical protein